MDLVAIDAIQGSRGPGVVTAVDVRGGRGGWSSKAAGAGRSHQLRQRRFRSRQRQRVMTDELRQRITDAYQPFKDRTEPLRIINAHFRQGLGKNAALVNAGCKSGRGSGSFSFPPMTITPEQHKQGC